MDRLLYVSMTGAAHNERAQAMHANNLANATTTGFKTDIAASRSMPVFGDVYASRVYALTERPASDTRAGALDATGRDLDIALPEGRWLAVQGADGREAYTRAASLQVDAAGTLRTATGQPVLGDGGVVTLPEFEQVEVGVDGTVTIRALGQGPENLLQVARLRIADGRGSELHKGIDGLFATADGTPLPVDPAARITSGALEQSNVNAVSEMVDILALARQFEVQVRMMRVADENAEAAARLVRVS